MGQLRLTDPVIITPRLLPGVRVGDGFVSVQRHARLRVDGRHVFSYFIDLPSGEHSGDDLSSPRPSLQEALATTLSFLSAAGEGVEYEQRTGRESDNARLFEPPVGEWAAQHSDELSMLANELDETDGLIEEEAGSRYEENAEAARESVTVYSYRVWTGPGRDRWARSFEQPGPYVQAERVFETEILVPVDFAERVRGVKGDGLADGRLIREAERMGYLKNESAPAPAAPPPAPAAKPPQEKAKPNEGKRVVVYEQTVTDESAAQGDYESVKETEDREADDVEDAARFISDHGGGFEASSSDFCPGIWYSSEPQQDMHTGAYVSYSFHPKGFSLAEQRKLWEAVTGRNRRLGRPRSS